MKIFSASNPPQAHIVCELLRVNNIACEVRGEGIFGLQGELPFGEASEPYVWLHDISQQNEARLLIEKFEQPQLEKNWHCSSCGEENEGQFALCWQCGEPIK
ncbi:hypothetical protein VII00023_19374 [Vibrio ichthyoenteri ATCC 700023]|uniref:RanBP2-type domain-containing protein n=1 Tax=Vibrio ichthyoenteri ATCC 700023 TaxID=870968 RepID=F9S3A5_9VIBR|nr:DUF2007 domain-containing protein [Vibrio ichthyoenteri]EGU38129.1 hypothetical protein VII00023_19374 [Vibrio ichthyoenteri ATCC 700023]